WRSFLGSGRERELGSGELVGGLAGAVDDGDRGDLGGGVAGAGAGLDVLGVADPGLSGDARLGCVLAEGSGDRARFLHSESGGDAVGGEGADAVPRDAGGGALGAGAGLEGGAAGAVRADHRVPLTSSC